MRVLVVGAGPSGLAAALAATRRGHDVVVLERDAIGASLLRWGATRFFSPLSMNLPAGAAELLPGAPAADAILTGRDYVRHVLEPLAASLPLRGKVLTGQRVVAIGRSGLLRGDHADHPLRAERSFRILVASDGEERWEEADAVLDASGVSTPVAVGAGGLPAPGEGRAAERMIRNLGELEPERLAGRRVLVVGHGHSAANALVVLASVASEAPATKVVWATRSLNSCPCTEVASDPLPERQRVVAAANQLAARPPAWLRVERRASVVAFRDELRVVLSGDRVVEAEVIIGMTGYRPDHDILSELAVSISAATEGAAGLSAALSRVTDCLAVPSVSPADLASGEPRFHLVGAKSYGRARTFLLRTGFSQIETLVNALEDRV